MKIIRSRLTSYRLEIDNVDIISIVKYLNPTFPINEGTTVKFILPDGRYFGIEAEYPIVVYTETEE